MTISNIEGRSKGWYRNSDRERDTDINLRYIGHSRITSWLQRHCLGVKKYEDDTVNRDIPNWFNDLERFTINIIDILPLILFRLVSNNNPDLLYSLIVSVYKHLQGIYGILYKIPSKNNNKSIDSIIYPYFWNYDF